MQRKGMLTIGGAVVAAVIAGSAVAGLALFGDDDDQPLTGTDLEQATAAALEATGGGTVVETEVGDDGAAFEVEVRLDDGTQVEVHLDQDFTVTGQEGDDDGAGDDD